VTQVPVPGVEIRRGGAELISQLEPLYSVLHEHHVSVAPTLAGMPARSAAESWRRRCALYESWLAVPGSFVLMAERDRAAVGYAVVSISDAFQSWASGDRVGDVYELAVVAAERGRGIGSALMDAVEAELVAAGIGEVRLRVIAANRDALRFYERRGLTPISHVLLGRV
jgi:ribosomal protein S18 acetylase RimI-like enzyme